MASKKKQKATSKVIVKKKATPRGKAVAVPKDEAALPARLRSLTVEQVEARAAALPSEVAEQNPGHPVGQLAAHALRTAELAIPFISKLEKLKDFDVTAVQALRAGAEVLGRRDATWSSVRAKSRAGISPARVKAAEAVRANMVADARFLLRKDATAQQELDQVQEGSGVADLAMDLQRLHDLFTRHSAVFEKAEATGDMATAASLAAELGVGIAPEEAPESQAQRNRAFHMLDADVSEVVEALRFLWRKEPTRLSQLGVRYSTQLRRQQRARRKPADPVG
jgi:hypothetical protein